MKKFMRCTNENYLFNYANQKEEWKITGFKNKDKTTHFQIFYIQKCWIKRYYRKKSKIF